VADYAIPFAGVRGFASIPIAPRTIDLGEADIDDSELTGEAQASPDARFFHQRGPANSAGFQPPADALDVGGAEHRAALRSA
jgi:hypothetical protein